MPKYVIDSYAWIEYFISSSIGEKVKQIVESQENEIFTSVITIAEVMSIAKRENRSPEIGFRIIMGLSKIHKIDENFAKEAGILHAEIRKRIKDFGMADSVVLLTARKLGARIITGDLHFKGFKEAMLI